MSVALRSINLSGLVLMILMGLALLAAQTQAVDRPPDAGDTFESSRVSTESNERPAVPVDADLSFRHNGE